MIKISILGCGWLGTKLSLHLNKTDFTINGSSTSDLNSTIEQNNQVNPYIVNISDTVENSQYDESFFNCDTLIISLKPNRQQNDQGLFENQINVCTVLAKKYGIKQVVLWSSTSVYGDNLHIVNEESPTIPTRPSGNSLLNAEQILLNEPSFNTTILRLGGLIGYERTPFQVIKNNKKTGSLHIPVNLVHVDDVILITEKVIQKENNNIYNVVCDAHPLRMNYYKPAFEELGTTPSEYDLTAKNAFKIVDNSKVKTALNYEFSLKNPVDLYTHNNLIKE